GDPLVVEHVVGAAMGQGRWGAVDVQSKERSSVGRQHAHLARADHRDQVAGDDHALDPTGQQQLARGRGGGPEHHEQEQATHARWSQQRPCRARTAPARGAPSRPSDARPDAGIIGYATGTMAAKILDGKALAARIRAGLAEEAKGLAARGVQPGLAVVLVGEDPASQIYVRNKTKASAEAGFRTFDHKLPADTSEVALLQRVAKLNADPAVDGILVQLPLPKQIDSNKVLLAISPAKDVDGFHPDNLGRLLLGKPRFIACTPFGVIKLIEEAGTPMAGSHAVVVGRSNIVGKPVAVLLTARDATVTL